MHDETVIEPFYRSVDAHIRALGARQVAETDLFFRVSRAAIGTNVDYSEIRRILGDIPDFPGWYDAWKAAAVRFAALGDEAAARSRAITAGEHWLRAALLFHFAQLFTRPEDPRRREGQRERVALYRKACPLLAPPVEPVAMPCASLPRGLTLPGYLRLPVERRGPVPVVLMIPGANSVKEELHNWAEAIVKRGVATLAFDGPGQGELSAANGGVALDLPRYAEAVSAAIDYVAIRPELDRDRVALLGQSTGGNFALGAAARERRIKALAALSGGFDFRGKTGLFAPVDVREEARDLYGLDSFAALSEYIERHGSLRGRIAEIRCPILLVYGGRDVIVKQEEIDAIRAEARVACDLHFYPDGNHSVCNRNLEMAPALADWLVEKLSR